MTPVAPRLDPFGRLAKPAFHALCGTSRGKPLRELVAIANLVAGEIQRTRQRRCRAPQGRLQLHAALSSHPLVQQSVAREKRGGALGAIQGLPGPIDLEHATRGAVVVDSGFGADFLQRFERM